MHKFMGMMTATASHNSYEATARLAMRDPAMQCRDLDQRDRAG